MITIFPPEPRTTGIYPVQISEQRKNIILMRYSSISLVFWIDGVDGEYWKDCDLYMVGDKLNLN